MATTVGLRDGEYNELESGVLNAHEQSLEEVERIVQRLEQLNQQGGGFYLSDLTPRIQAFIKQIEATKSTMDAVYNAHQQVIQSFRNSISNHDASC